MCVVPKNRCSTEYSYLSLDVALLPRIPLRVCGCELVPVSPDDPVERGGNRPFRRWLKVIFSSLLSSALRLRRSLLAAEFRQSTVLCRLLSSSTSQCEDSCLLIISNIHFDELRILVTSRTRVAFCSRSSSSEYSDRLYFTSTKW